VQAHFIEPTTGQDMTFIKGDWLNKVGLLGPCANIYGTLLYPMPFSRVHLLLFQEGHWRNGLLQEKNCECGEETLVRHPLLLII